MVCAAMVCGAAAAKIKASKGGAAALVASTEAVHIREQNQIAEQDQQKQQWGFLKNIVNIDRNSDSGVKA